MLNWMFQYDCLDTYCFWVSYMHAFSIFEFAPVHRNWACFTWKSTLEIRSLLLLLLLLLLLSLLLLVGCLSSHQHARVSQGWIHLDNGTCCHSEIESVGQTFHLTQSQYTDTRPTIPTQILQCQAPGRVDTGVPIFSVTGMIQPGKKICSKSRNWTQVCYSWGKRLTTRPRTHSVWRDWIYSSPMTKHEVQMLKWSYCLYCPETCQVHKGTQILCHTIHCQTNQGQGSITQPRSERH